MRLIIDDIVLKKLYQKQITERLTFADGTRDCFKMSSTFFFGVTVGFGGMGGTTGVRGFGARAGFALMG